MLIGFISNGKCQAMPSENQLSNIGNGKTVEKIKNTEKFMIFGSFEFVLS